MPELHEMPQLHAVDSGPVFSSVQTVNAKEGESHPTLGTDCRANDTERILLCHRPITARRFTGLGSTIE